MIEKTSMVCVGVITGAHGIRGQVRIKSFTGEPDNVTAYGSLYDEHGGRPLRLTITGRSRQLLIASVAGVGDRNGAEALIGRRLFVPREALPEPDEDEFYHADLIGLAAELRDGAHGERKALGTVRGVFDFGASDLLEVEASDGGTMMVPFTREAVPEVDLAGGRILIAPLPGLLGDDPVRSESAEPARRQEHTGQ